MLEQEDPDDLAGCEADRLQHRQVPQMPPDAGGDRPVHREPRGDQRAQSEQAEHLAEQPVVALRRGARLLPGGDLADRARAEHRDGALHRVVRVPGITQPQPDHLAAGGAHGGRRCPDQARLLARAVAGLGTVRDALDGQGAGRPGQREGVARLGQQGSGQAALQHHAVRFGRVRPVPGGCLLYTF